MLPAYSDIYEEGHTRVRVDCFEDSEPRLWIENGSMHLYFDFSEAYILRELLTEALLDATKDLLEKYEITEKENDDG